MRLRSLITSGSINKTALAVFSSDALSSVAYPSGGGAYIVAKDNLGEMPGLVAGAALLIDYILTVAVSISAGVAAITSAVQGTRFAFLQDHRVAICLVHGPTYLFILSMLALIVGGFYYGDHHLDTIRR